MASSTDVLPPAETQALVALDEARRQIEVARTSEDVDALLTMRDQALAVQHYLTRRNEAKQLADDAGELKVRAEAALGQLDRSAAPHGGSRDGEGEGEEAEEQGNGTATLPDPDAPPAPLADVRRNTRAQWRKLGTLESPQLDSVVEQLRNDDDGGVTTARAVRLAREILPAPERKVQEGEELDKNERKELVTDFVAHLRALDTETSTCTRLAKKVIPNATNAERTRMASRLQNTVIRLEELKEYIEIEESGE